MSADERGQRPDPPSDWPEAVYDALRHDAAQGLRLLRLLTNTRRWVHTRAEAIRFYDDRLVHRRVSVDFTVPDLAPQLELPDGRTLLIPLTLMRKDTLVNFDLRDEAGGAMSVLSVRQIQALSYAMLHAWGGVVLDGHGDRRVSDDVDMALEGIAGLIQHQVAPAWQRFRATGNPDDQFSRLYGDARFRVILNRFASSFPLLVPLEAPPGRRRTLKFSYDEPLSLKYFDTPPLAAHRSEAPTSAAGSRTPLPRARSSASLDRRPLRDAIGLSATPIRFPTPAAEHCQNYYFEITAPEGTQIERSSLLAHRIPVEGQEADRHPQGATRRAELQPQHVWFDAQAGALTRVTLHVADAPEGSVCYGQTHLRLANDGWIQRAWYACVTSAVILLLILGVALLAPATVIGINIPVSFFAIIAGGLSIVLARPAHAMAGRLLRWLRPITTVVAVLPVIAASVMLQESIPEAQSLMRLPRTVAVSGWLLAIPVCTGALIRHIIHKSRHPEVVRSAWAHRRDDTEGLAEYGSFWEAVTGESYDKPAVVVVSGEGARAPGDEDAAAWADGLSDRINGLLHQHATLLGRTRSQG